MASLIALYAIPSSPLSPSSSFNYHNHIEMILRTITYQHCSPSYEEEHPPNAIQSHENQGTWQLLPSQSSDRDHSDHDLVRIGDSTIDYHHWLSIIIINIPPRSENLHYPDPPHTGTFPRQPPFPHAIHSAPPSCVQPKVLLWHLGRPAWEPLYSEEYYSRTRHDMIIIDYHHYIQSSIWLTPFGEYQHL